MDNIKDEKFAQGWHAKQGHFSDGLARGIVDYVRNTGLKIQSALDVCCGSGEFIDRLKNFIPYCVGCSYSAGMIEYSKKILPDIEFFYVADWQNFKHKSTFDLISCNHDVINYLEKWEDWEKFVFNCFKHLNKGGHLIFDVFTRKKLEGLKETTYETSDDMDYVTKIEPVMGNTSSMSDVFYVKNFDGLYQKTSSIVTKTFFDNDKILDLIKRAGFKSVEFFDSHMKPLESWQDKDRIHFWCEK